MNKYEDARFVVTFKSRLSSESQDYGPMAEKMRKLAEAHDGYLGMDSVRGDDGIGISISYWRDWESIVRWKYDADHLVAKSLGKSRWYEDYCVKIAEVRDPPP
ncbi:MAG: antibiotic biosynthesis monooxygenase [Bdellovibrionota bacterium]